MKKKILIFIFLLLTFFALPKKAEAIKFSLIAPSGQLERGQTIQFTISINTEGATVTSQQIGMTYETQYLEYVGTTPGAAMTTVSKEDLGGGKLLFTGSNSSGFSGSNTFALVSFKIVATSPGSTQLCTLWAPSPTATPIPTSPPGTAQPTSPLPTTMPRTGAINKTVGASVLGGIFFIGAASFYFLSKNSKYEKPHNKKTKKL